MMVFWRRWVWYVVCALLAGAAWGTPAEVFTEDVEARHYDCRLTLHATETLAQTAHVHLQLDRENDAACTSLDITPRRITLQSATAKEAFAPVQLDANLATGAPRVLLILRRDAWLGILCNDQFLFRGPVPRAAGKGVHVTADAGWTVEQVRVQPLEPVMFADNFMRTADEPGAWTTRGGVWQLQSAWDDDPRGNGGRFQNIRFAQNPFAWQGQATDGPALCTTGQPFWEDYTLTAAVQPPAGGAVGVMVNMPDGHDGLLIRWSPVNDHGAQGNALLCYRVQGGTRTLLASSPGGYLPGQWYRLTVTTALAGIRIAVDGQERLALEHLLPWRGGVGLYAEGKTRAVFHNVTVYGHALNTDLLEESAQRRLSARILEDPQMQNWARDWLTAPQDATLHIDRRECAGDQRMVLTLSPGKDPAGALSMVLQGDGHGTATGYSAVIRQDAGEPTSYTLFYDSTPLATAKGAPLQPEEEYTLRFWHEGNHLWLEQDGLTVVEAHDTHAPTGRRALYRAEGALSDVHSRLVIGRNVRDYLFTDAPVDWIGEGTWEPTVRWACDPKWSFLSGWSTGDAVLWHKQQFLGDQSFEAYLGIKMEYPHERATYERRYRDLGITICGDGHNPRSGYTGIFGAPDEDGHPNRRTVLLRQGVEVASIRLPMPSKDTGHREWFQLLIKKQGATVEFWVENSLLLTYVDPEPLAGGVPAIWTTDNGISVARARLHFSEPPQPRTDVRVALDPLDPPAWCNVGKSYTFAFPNACATSGKPVTLQARALAGPAGVEAVRCSGTQVTFTPREIGNYWYGLTAVEGDHRSPTVHLLAPVFNPALGRDDTHALVLYRFDEGSGLVAHDASPVAPRHNLLIARDDLQQNRVRWLPEQGVLLNAPAALLTAAYATKLAAIAATNACTLECWVAPTTRYPQWGRWPRVWEGTLFSWGARGGLQNFALGHHTETGVLLAGPTIQLTPSDARTCTFPGFHSALLHIVITWDGDTTTIYLNGVRQTERTYPWHPAQWTPNVLQLGSLLDQERPYLGAYYLLAIHDCALTAAQVQRHYRAGPSAR